MSFYVVSYLITSCLIFVRIVKYCSFKYYILFYFILSLFLFFFWGPNLGPFLILLQAHFEAHYSPTYSPINQISMALFAHLSTPNAASQTVGHEASPNAYEAHLHSPGTSFFHAPAVSSTFQTSSPEDAFLLLQNACKPAFNEDTVASSQHRSPSRTTMQSMPIPAKSSLCPPPSCETYS